MQLPSRTLVSEYSFVAPSDPALEINHGEQTEERAKEFAEQWRLYNERGDESHLKFKAGEEPTRWKLRHVTGRVGKLLLGEGRRCGEEKHRWGLACWTACAYGLVGAKGLLTEEGGDADFPTVMCPEFKVQRLPDSFLEKIDLIPPRELIEEIGGKILMGLRSVPL